MNEKLLIKSNCEVYLKTPTEIKLSEFDDKLFEFKQYITAGSTSEHTRDIFYGDFECTTDGDYHEPYLCCIKKRGVDPINTFQGADCIKQHMDYLFTNFKTSTVIFHNLAYDGRLVRYEFNVDKTLEKGKQIFTQSFTRNGHVIMFIDSYAKISYKLSMFPKIFDIGNIVKEILPYNYYSSQRVFREGSEKILRKIS